MEQVNTSWGYYEVIKHVTGSADSFDSYKIKNLYINPGQSLSDQRHFTVLRNLDNNARWLTNEIGY